jgi:hypothetical protein
MNRRAAAVVVSCVAMLAACSSSSSKSAVTQPSSAPTTTAAAPTAAPAPAPKPSTPDTQVWLCKPGVRGNPCLSSMATTVVAGDGSTTAEKSTPASDPKIDCFYVYPTVSNQQTVNANLHIDEAETGVAIAQASRYSQVCRVYAPMYRQITIGGLFKQNAAAGALAFSDVKRAWLDYLARYNDGRGVVLIGHSQGSFQLKELIAKVIEPDAPVRARIVSAILLGGNVNVPIGKDVGGDLKYLRACHSATQLNCVIAYSSFDHDPPVNSLFGRSRVKGDQILCTNPAALGGGSGPVLPYIPAHRIGGPFSFTQLPTASTPWVSYPDLFTAECKNVGGASWLQINDVRKAGDNRPVLKDALGPTWGLHLYDGNIALGNLVDIVRSETAAYGSKG